MLPFLLFVRALLLPFLVLLLPSLGSQAAVPSVALSFSSFFTFFQCVLLCAFYSFLFCTILLYNFIFLFSYSRSLIRLHTSFATVLRASLTTSLATTTNLFSYLPCLLPFCAFFLLLFFHLLLLLILLFLFT